MKGKFKRRKVKNIVLKTITALAVITIFVCMSGVQVWNGMEWVEPDPLSVIVPIALATGWIIAFCYANGLT